MFIKNTPSVCFFASLFACLLAVYLRQHIDSAWVYWWLSVKIAVVIPRIVHAWSLRSRDKVYRKADYFWSQTLIFLDGAWWGAVCVMFVPVLDEQTITVLGCALIGIVSVASFTLHVHSMSLLLYCVPILLPGSLMLLLRNDTFGWFMALAGVLFLLGLISVAKRANANIKEMLWRRFSMDRIIEEKEAALAEAARQDNIKSQFVATMSHELRTPLHGILGLTHMLKEQHTEASTVHQLGLIERTGEHLLMLINRVLDFSRIEAGYLTLDIKPFDLTQLLIDTISLTTVNAHSKGLELTYRLDMPEHNWVEGDAPKFKQILLNLIGNAIKFTNAGKVHIEATYASESGISVIQIKDTGIGIPLKDLPTIFEPYKQAKAVAGGPTGGTGLGLTISREISRAMEGNITCESKEGVGSTFTFYAALPHWHTNENTDFDALSAATQLSDTNRDALAQLQLNGHVLLAEDNEVNALIVDLQLQRKGLTVEHVKNGQEALDRLLRTDQKRPDVVLMDCQMPLVDGFEATQKLRAYEKQNRLSRLPVIALTASAMAEDSTRCLNSGMDAHLSKPFNEEQLITLLISYLRPMQPAYH